MYFNYLETISLQFWWWKFLHLGTLHRYDNEYLQSRFGHCELCCTESAYMFASNKRHRPWDTFVEPKANPRLRTTTLARGDQQNCRWKSATYATGSVRYDRLRHNMPIQLKNNNSLHTRYYYRHRIFGLSYHYIIWYNKIWVVIWRIVNFLNKNKKNRKAFRTETPRMVKSLGSHVSFLIQSIYLIGKYINIWHENLSLIDPNRGTVRESSHSNGRNHSQNHRIFLCLSIINIYFIYFNILFCRKKLQ